MFCTELQNPVNKPNCLRDTSAFILLTLSAQLRLTRGECVCVEKIEKKKERREEHTVVRNSAANLRNERCKTLSATGLLTSATNRTRILRLLDVYMSRNILFAFFLCDIY